MTSSNANLESAPLDNFSQCHSGIVRHLNDLDSLVPLLEPARQAHRLAAEAVRFFRSSIFEHHDEEERELFPAVIANANADERSKAQEAVDRLVREHRHLESVWSKLQPQLDAVAHGGVGDVDVDAIKMLVANYQAHAKFEEDVFLPLAKAVLARQGEHMAALGLRLHMRHTPLQVTPF
ncbi:hemerythrin domain-containing protein [Thauera aminoaromatica]|uniref:Hemerythrin domain-containing protein n=1 Tax=Thauera aminoaromatica TaxID=164330 RepID=A0A5C7SM26_THASP|nr:hemerythrin domain-containing protein [Thauera aminoaromatica]TXH84442.1 MAG: hemerythrin domain-containing protein [Thauera aminoaromatica]